MTQTSNRMPIVLAALAGLASLVACLLLYGSAFGTQAMVLALPDAAGYHAVGTALWAGQAPEPGLLPLRGYLFPMVATALAQISPTLLFAAQTLAMTAGIFFLGKTEIALAGRILLTPAALCSVSLLVAPSTMMTESFALALGAAATWSFAAGSRPALGTACLFLAAIIKPAFLPVALVAALMTLRFNRASLATLLFAIFLFIPQLILTHQIDGKAQLSSAGSYNVNMRFYPAVKGMVETGQFQSYKTDFAKAAQAERPDTKDQATYILSHPVAAARTWVMILTERHLTETSGFTYLDNAAARPDRAAAFLRASGVLNAALLGLATFGAIGALVFLLRRPVAQWPAVLIAPSILATAPLVYWQGDRVVFFALLWALPFAGYLLAPILDRRQTATP